MSVRPTHHDVYTRGWFSGLPPCPGQYLRHPAPQCSPKRIHYVRVYEIGKDLYQGKTDGTELELIPDQPSTYPMWFGPIPDPEEPMPAPPEEA